MRPDGTPCKAWASELDGLCYWHSELRRKARLEGARKGGLNSRSGPATIMDELPAATPLTARETRQLIASVSRSVSKGSVDASTARSLTYLLSLDRRIADSELLEAKVAELEERVTAFGETKGFTPSNAEATRVPHKSGLKRVGDSHVD